LAHRHGNAAPRDQFDAGASVVATMPHCGVVLREDDGVVVLAFDSDACERCWIQALDPTMRLNKLGLCGLDACVMLEPERCIWVCNRLARHFARELADTPTQPARNDLCLPRPSHAGRDVRARRKAHYLFLHRCKLRSKRAVDRRRFGHGRV
jgi:hypothetical protein